MIRLPRGLILQHGIQDDQQFPSRRDQSNFRFLPSIDEPLVEGLDPVVVLHTRQSPHIQGSAHVGPTALDVALSFPRAALLGDRSQAHQWATHELDNLLAVCLPKLRKASRQHAGGRLPDPGHRAQKIFLDLPGGSAFDELSKLAFDLFDLFAKVPNVFT
jgi:hypothetical protein